MKKLISAVLIFSVLNISWECYSGDYTSKDNLKINKDKKLKVINLGGREYNYEAYCWFTKKDTFYLIGHDFANDIKV